jgi:hypothetical protein
MASSEIILEAVPSVGDVLAEEWNACANPPGPHCNDLNGVAANALGADPKPHYNPFVSHAFFSAVETSSSACARTGWGPRHLIAKVDGQVQGIVPCYLKSH